MATYARAFSNANGPSKEPTSDRDISIENTGIGIMKNPFKRNQSQEEEDDVPEISREYRH